MVAAFLLLCCGAEPQGYEVVNRTPAYTVVNKVPASGVVSGPTVSPDGYYELRQTWDGATWVQTWELRKAVSRPAVPFGRGTTAQFVPGVSTSSPVTTATAPTITLVPPGTVGGTSDCPPGVP